MPTQVPYSGTLDTQPQVDPLPQAHVDTPVAAFGGAVAQAIGHIGEVAQVDGKELFGRAYAMQEMSEQMRADKASADAMDKQLQRYMEYDKLQGFEREQGYKDYVADLEKIRNEGAEGLNSPYAKMQYLRDTRRNESTMLWHGTVLAREGHDQATVSSASALSEAAGNQVVVTGAKGDVSGMDSAIATWKQNAASIVPAKLKLTPGSPGQSEAVDQYVSDQLGQTISKMITSDPHTATALFDQYSKSGVLKATQTADLKGRLEDAVNNKDASRLALEIAANSGKKPPDELAKDIAIAADKAYPGNKTFAFSLTEKTNGVIDSNKLKQIKADQEFYQQAINIIDGVTTGGKVPRSWPEVVADPNFAKLLPKLQDDPTLVDKLQKKVFENNSTNGWRPNEKGNAEYTELQKIGMLRSSSTPEQLDKLLGFDFASSSMTKEQRKEIMGYQKDILKSQGEPSNVERLMAVPTVQSVLAKEGIQKNTDEYTKFATQFGRAIEGFEEGAHRTAKGMDELGEIAQKLITHDPEKAYGWLGRNPRLYQQDPFDTDRKIDKAKAMFRKANNGLEPTDADLDTMRVEVLKSMFKRLGASSPPQQTAPSKLDNKAQ
jgi:hypothetical protein